ncbi:YadA family autotransporter adhesin, partial [Rodentibacter ratti]|uniref:YadA family autotransporter adhesin n=1 Tax=Rodentibacter ratti TaxID=1906745 RepID=UPI0015C306B5
SGGNLNLGGNKITNLAPGKDGTDAVNVDQLKDAVGNSGWKANATGNVDGTSTLTDVKPGSEVNFAAGKNLTVNQTVVDGNHTYTYALADDITIGEAGKDGKDGKDGVDGKIGVNGKDGSSVVINGKDGSIGLTGPRGADGKDGASATIRAENGKDGVDGLNGKDGKTRIVYESKDPNGNPIREEVATLNDGLKFVGDDGNTIVKKLNETLAIEGGADKANLTENNIGVNNKDGKLLVQLSKDIDLTDKGSIKIGDTSINNNGLTINGGPSITNKGIDAGSKVITNVAPGVNGTDAVNVDQLNQAVSTSKTTVTGDKGVKVTPSKNADGSMNYNVAAKTDGVTITIDKAGNIAAKTTPLTNNANGSVNTPANPDSLATAGDIANAINNSGFNIIGSGNGSGFANELINPSDTVTLDAGKNVTIVQSGGKFTFATSDNISLGQKGQPGKDGVDGSIGVNGKDGSAVVINGKDGSIGLNGKDGANGLTIKGEQGPTGVDGKAGESKTRIVYQPTNPDGTPKGEPEKVATLNDGLRFAGNDNVEKAHKLNTVVRVKGEGVNESASKAFKSASGNINVRADNNGTLEVQLAKDLKGINSISNGQSSVTLNENGGTTIKGGDVNVSGNKITNVKAGTADTDAVNVGQLRGVANNIHNRINKVSKEARGGIAGANAAASLPQVYLPGKSMVAASAGTFKGQNALAVGYSRASDNGKLILKLQGNANSQGDVGAGVGIGYQW